MANFTRNQLNADSDSHFDKSSVSHHRVRYYAYQFWHTHSFFETKPEIKKIFNGQLSIIRIALIFELASKRTQRNKGKNNEM